MISHKASPFDKYLYSGAFYVQAANTYRLMSEWFDKTEPEQKEALLGIIRDSWLQSTTLPYSSVLSSMGLPAKPAQAAVPQEMIDPGQIIARAAPRIVDEVVDRISNCTHEILTLPVFIEIWVEACAKAHAELIRSEEFIECMTDIINRAIKISVKALRDAESGHE